MQPAFKTLAKLTSNQNFDVLTSKDFSEYLRGSSSDNTNITQKFPNSQKDNYQKTDKSSKNIYRNKIFYQVQNVSISSLLVVKTRFVEWTKDQFWDTIFRMSFSAVIISFIILFSIKFLAVWFNIKRSDIRSIMLVVTPILFYIAISFSVVLSMNSDQLSTITSLFAMLVILRVFFKHPIDKIISLINLRIDKLIGKNRKVQQADLNKSVENHEKTNDK